ncbi:hypothetical protein GOZ89_13905 [Agrobacterium vitis]|uniref:TniQ family protein n=1 Tax=Agrobacterium vitis TaxID=373 RepID=UPI0012E965A5|nr:TniQ family protein [Agrobacterium vitis]MVA80518.1 hypothetical protein [Agrobacterium vitis]
MVLPVTLVHHDLETPIDFVARLAAANGFSSLRDFLAHTEIGVRAIIAGDVDALAVVAEWSGVPAARLARWAVAGNGPGGTWRMGCATLSKDMRAGRKMRFCAQCVLEDREREPGRMAARAYRRAWWNVNGIEGCTAHKCALTEVRVAADGDVHDFPQFVKANLGMIEEGAAAPLLNRQPRLDAYLRDRMFLDHGDGFLDGLDAHVVAEFSRYLGDCLVLHDIRAWMHEETNPREWGFNLAAMGEDEIRRVFAEIIDRKRPTTQYVESVVGPMAKWFRRNAAKEAYGPVIDLIQDILERNMPFGEGQIIFKPVRTRHLYCVNSAHADSGINKDRIRALMKANDPNFRDGLPDSGTYFDAAALRPILEEATGTLTSKEAWSLLGVAEATFHHLLKDGILHQVETRGGGERAYTRIRADAVDDLIRRISNRTTLVADDEDMMSLSEAARAMHREYRNLVAMVLSGSLEAFMVQGEEPVFQRLRLKKGALKIDAGRTAGGDEKLMRLKEAELALGTTTGTINELISRGYLRTQHVRRETGLTVKFVERQSLIEFNDGHASLSAIAKSRQGYRASIKCELEALGVAPIFEPKGFNARFYCRADLVQAGFNI